jgi:hypothetical protein
MPRLRTVAVLAATTAVLAGAPTAAAAPRADAAGADRAACRQSTKLFLRYGISSVTARHVSCRRAVRTLTRWARSGTQGRGPRGWRCTVRHHGGPAAFDRHRCRRGAATVRFHVGG